MKIYQSYMDAQQKGFICDQAIPFDASANCEADTREYELFRKIHADPAIRNSDEPWGLVSWKFDHKSPVDFRVFHDFCDNAFADGADCAFINPMIGNEAIYANVWEQGIHCGHKGIEKIGYFLEEHAKIRVTAVSDVRTFAFCNYFVANNRFWEHYFRFTEQALGLLQDEARRGTETGRIYSGAGHYERDRSASMRIFIIERLFSSFLLQQEDFRIVAWKPSAADYERKFGVRIGRMLENFSRVKQQAVATDDVSLYNIWNRHRTALLTDWQINMVWNLDDPHTWTLTREYQEFQSFCDGLPGEEPEIRLAQSSAS